MSIAANSDSRFIIQAQQGVDRAKEFVRAKESTRSCWQKSVRWRRLDLARLSAGCNIARLPGDHRIRRTLGRYRWPVGVIATAKGINWTALS